jgi:DNA-binding transcriptional LysR family regulator
MQRGNLDDLLAFLAVGRERSFTKGAARLGLSQSALSHTIRELEARLGVRLLTRTTRSVSPTDAGERLLNILAPRFEEIDAELAALSELRKKPAGTIRITATDYAADTVLWPKLATFLPRFPDIKVELIIDHGLTDIVAQRFDAGVRAGEQVAKDMIAVRIGPDLRMAVVGAPSYFRKRPEPKRPPDHLRRPLRLGVRKGRP